MKMFLCVTHKHVFREITGMIVLFFFRCNSKVYDIKIAKTFLTSYAPLAEQGQGECVILKL
jgi:hypothetical protein